MLISTAFVKKTKKGTFIDLRVIKIQITWKHWRLKNLVVVEAARITRCLKNYHIIIIERYFNDLDGQMSQESVEKLKFEI